MSPMQPQIPALTDISLPDILRSFQAGLFTSTDLVKAYLARIAEVDHEYHSVIETNPDALTIAGKLDSSRRRGLLHGIPLLLKDNIPTLDATETTCGSLALIGAKPVKEAAVVTALRRAGAVLLGKANMAEWVGFRSTSGCSGWSPRGGQLKGIFYKNMKASGSSGGSAVATALGLCFAAIGTETCYSIVSPAERSGIIGYKPTKNLISSEGMIYASKRVDTVGLLTRTVTDAVHILIEIIQQTDHYSADKKVKSVQDIGPACSLINLSGVRIGVPGNLSEMSSLPSCKTDAFEKALGLLECAGATIVRGIDIRGAGEYEGLSKEERHVILDTDMKIAIDEYLSTLLTNPQNIYSIEDLVRYIKACPGEDFPARNVEVLERAQPTDTTNEFFQTMLKRDAYFAGDGGIAGALERHNCEVLLVPGLSVTMQTFAAKAGSPVMSVPIGWYPERTEVEIDEKNGLVTVAPGISFSAYIFGRVDKDQDVIRVGYVLEQSTRTRERLQPYFEPSTEIVDIIEK